MAFLLSMAAEGLYRPLWSEAILDELHEHEALKLLNRGAAQADALARSEQLLDRMRSAFDDALVTGWEPLEGSFGLPDPNDEHVVAAAVAGGEARDRDASPLARRLASLVEGRPPEAWLFATARGNPWRHADFHSDRWAPALRHAARYGLQRR